jgi:hypothetical protein
VAKSLLNVVTLLGKETDIQIMIALLCLGMALLRDDDAEGNGKINPSNIPCNVFCAMLTSFMRLRRTLAVPVDPDLHPVSESKPTDSKNPINSNSAQTEVKQSGIRAKRKLSSTSRSNSHSQSSQSLNQPLTDSQSTVASSQSTVFDEMDSVSEAKRVASGSNDGTMCDLLRGVWSDLTTLLSGSAEQPCSDVVLAIGLNLVLVNRIVVSVIHRIIDLESKLLDSDGDDMDEDQQTADNGDSNEANTAAELKRMKSLLTSMQESFRCITYSGSAITVAGVRGDVVASDAFIYELCEYFADCTKAVHLRCPVAHTDPRNMHTWLILSMFDSACYGCTDCQVRNPDITTFCDPGLSSSALQVILAQKHLHFTVAAHEEDHKNSVPLLVHLLQLLPRIVGVSSGELATIVDVGAPLDAEVEAIDLTGSGSQYRSKFLFPELYEGIIG